MDYKAIYILPFLRSHTNTISKAVPAELPEHYETVTYAAEVFIREKGLRLKAFSHMFLLNFYICS